MYVNLRYLHVNTHGHMSDNIVGVQWPALATTDVTVVMMAGCC